MATNLNSTKHANLALNINGESSLHNVQTLGIKIEDKTMIA